MSDQITYDDKADLIVDTTIDNMFKVSASDMNEIKNVVNSHADDIDVANNNINDLNNNKLDKNEVLNQASADTDKPYSADYLNDKLVSVGTTAPTDGRRVYFANSKNLFNINNIYVKRYINSSGLLATSNNWSATDFIKIQPNTTYTLSGVTNSGTVAKIAFYSNQDVSSFLSVIGSTEYTFTTPNNANYVRLSLNSETTTSAMLEEGSTATSYEPYVEKSINVDDESFISMSDLVSVGVNQPSDGKRVWFAKSKNLLPQNQYVSSTTINGIIFTNNGDGTFNLSGTATANTTIMIMPANIINLEANQPYYLYSSTPYDVNTFNLSIAMTDNSTSKFIIANNTYTPTATPTNVRLQFYIGSGKSVNATNVKLMLVKGSTAPGEYEPYVEEGIYVDNENWLFDNYSTSEQVIGKWIDGKNLYRKCYSAGALKNNGQTEISLNISNFNKLVKMYGVSYSSGYTMILPFVHGTASNIVNMYFNNTSKVVGIETHSDRTSYTETYVVVEYTKTTD